MSAKRRKPPQWQFHLIMAVGVAMAVVFAVVVVNNWRRIGPADAAVARYQAAPRCATGPDPGCRAEVPGTIERAEVRRVSRGTRRQWLAVRFPEAVREVELPRNLAGRKAQPYGAFQPGTSVTAEWWEDWVVTLAAGEVGEPTRAHPEQVAARRRENREAGLVMAAAFLGVAAFAWWVSRWPASLWER